MRGWKPQCNGEPFDHAPEPAENDELPPCNRCGLDLCDCCDDDGREDQDDGWADSGGLR